MNKAPRQTSNDKQIADKKFGLLAIAFGIGITLLFSILISLLLCISSNKGFVECLKSQIEIWLILLGYPCIILGLIVIIFKKPLFLTQFISYIYYGTLILGALIQRETGYDDTPSFTIAFLLVTLICYVIYSKVPMTDSENPQDKK